MASVYDTLSAWARKTTTSFAELLAPAPDRTVSVPAEEGEQIFRLKHWPQLPASLRNADVYRTLSVMSHRPVNRRWILVSSRLTTKQVDRLIALLRKDDAVDVIDTSGFGPSSPTSSS